MPIEKNTGAPIDEDTRTRVVFSNMDGVHLDFFGHNRKKCALKRILRIFSSSGRKKMETQRKQGVSRPHERFVDEEMIYGSAGS